MNTQPRTVYEQLGDSGFEQLVAAFYRRISVDPVIGPFYAPHELPAAERRLRMFLIQYWGGPGTYSEERGHPRLKMRHQPYRIGEAQRVAWLKAMFGAMDEVGIPEPSYSAMRTYFESGAAFMMNVRDPNVPLAP